MLNRLVLADRTIEYDTFPRIARCAAQRILTDPDRFDGDQDSLGIQAMENVGKALAFLSNPVLFGNEQTVDKDGVRIYRLAAHLRNSPYLDFRTIEVGIENGDAVGRSLAVLVLGRPGQQHDLVGDLRRRRQTFCPWTR